MSTWKSPTRYARLPPKKLFLSVLSAGELIPVQLLRE